MLANIIPFMQSLLFGNEVVPIRIIQGRAYIRTNDRWVETTDSIAETVLGARREPCPHVYELAKASLFSRSQYKFVLMGGTPPTTRGAQCLACGYTSVSSGSGLLHPYRTVLIAKRNWGTVQVATLKN